MELSGERGGGGFTVDILGLQSMKTGDNPNLTMNIAETLHEDFMNSMPKFLFDLESRYNQSDVVHEK